MKKFSVFFLVLAFIVVCTTACTNSSKKPNMIQSKRRFENYVNPQSQKDPHVIDMSEGPKLNYNAKFGPKAPEFDVKIVDPYSY